MVKAKICEFVWTQSGPRSLRSSTFTRAGSATARLSDRKRAILAAWETGGYSYQHIGDDFGVYFTTLVPFDSTTGNRHKIKR